MPNKERRLKNLISTASLVKTLKKYGYDGYYAEPAIYRLFKEQGIEPKKTIGGKSYFNRKNATDCLIRNLFYVKQLSDEIDKKEIYDQLNKNNVEHGDTVSYGRNDMSTVSRELLANDGVFGADENELYKNENKYINMDNKKLIRLTESDLHRIIKESVNKILNEIGDTPVGQYQLGRLSQRNKGIYGDDRGVHDYSRDNVNRNDAPLSQARLKGAYVSGVKDQESFMDSVDKDNESLKNAYKNRIRTNAETYRSISDKNLKKKYRI